MYFLLIGVTEHQRGPSEIRSVQNQHSQDRGKCKGCDVSSSFFLQSERFALLVLISVMHLGIRPYTFKTYYPVCLPRLCVCPEYADWNFTSKQSKINVAKSWLRIQEALLCSKLTPNTKAVHRKELLLFGKYAHENDTAATILLNNTLFCNYFDNICKYFYLVVFTNI